PLSSCVATVVTPVRFHGPAGRRATASHSRVAAGQAPLPATIKTHVSDDEEALVGQVEAAVQPREHELAVVVRPVRTVGELAAVKIVDDVVALGVRIRLDRKIAGREDAVATDPGED